MRTTMRMLFVSGHAAVLILGIAAEARALTVCGDLRYWDSREERASGSYLTGTPGFNAPARRVYINAYDQDGACRDKLASCNEQDDEYLGSVYSNSSTGRFCFPNDIAWDNDLYLHTTYLSDDSGVKDSMSAWRTAVSNTQYDFGQNYAGSTFERDWNITCTDDSVNTVQGLCNNQTSVTSNFPITERFANILQSMVDVDVLVTDSDYYLNNNNLRIFAIEGSSWDTNCSGSQNLSLDCTYFCLATFSYDNPYTVAHETGHNLHKRAMGYCSAVSGCVGNFVAKGEGEKCAFAEGWADFVAAATYWPPNASAPAYRGTSGQPLEGITVIGNQTAKICAGFGDSPEVWEANAARFFWDLYDTTTIFDYDGTYTDNNSDSFHNLLIEWDEFPAGTGDGDRAESGLDGRNAWDFRKYYPNSFSEIYVNCLDGSVPNSG